MLAMPKPKVIISPSPLPLVRARSVSDSLLSGFTTDIGAEPDDLNEAVSLFFVTFVVLQPVSAAAGRYIGAKHWIPLLMVIRRCHK